MGGLEQHGQAVVITKKAVSFPEHLGSAALFESARAGLSAFYRSQASDGRLRVILPAYIGWSPNEGSGLFDSVVDGNYEYEFYELDRQGNARIESLEAIEHISRPSVLVLVHYFGRPDPRYDALTALGQDRGWAMVDDCAHAMLTHLCSTRLGERSDAMVYSLHKMLPMKRGGVLLSTAGEVPDGLPADEALQTSRSFLGYDHASAARHRQQVAASIQNGMPMLDGFAAPLWRDLDLTTIVPQSYPLVVHAGAEKRNLLYERLHEQYGLTTLYHTLVEPLRVDDRFEDSRWLSDHIINLPVHAGVPLASVEATLLAIRHVLSE